MTSSLPVNQILMGETTEILGQLPEASVDLVFADPPYNLQLQQALWRPNHTQVDAVDDAWDQFDDLAAYDAFTRAWLLGVRRVMKPNATIWISGTYHNIFRVGSLLQDLGFWVLNTITWFKPNAMPNFRGRRLKNDVEFIIWAKYSQRSAYTFRHHRMKQFNDGKQLGSVWQIPICGGAERLRDSEGRKLHPTQKPEALLTRILLASSRAGDVVLDPFFGSGTTGAVAAYLRRQWVGIEREPAYVEAAQRRIDSVEPLPADDPLIAEDEQDLPLRIPFATLLEHGYLQVGQTLYLDGGEITATILEGGRVQANGFAGSIHKIGAHLRQTPSCNGWMHWYYQDDLQDERRPINVLREALRRENKE